MDSFAPQVFGLAVVGGAIILTMFRISKLPRSSARILSECVAGQGNIDDFLDGRTRNVSSDRCYIFKEQMVSCPEHGFRGRFDQAILRFGETPMLTMMIERKFPTRHLPTNGRPEDFFQAGLYSLAFASRGVDCGCTILLVIYCKQADASLCANRSLPSRCIVCSKGRTFPRRYKPARVLDVLHRLDSFWYAGQKPHASPNPRKCAACAFGKSGECRYSVLQQKSHLGKWF